MKHFIHETDFSFDETKEIFLRAFFHKRNRRKRSIGELVGQSWGLLFYKNSTRTKVSFEVGIQELGGHPLTLDHSTSQIGRGESIKDTVKVLSRYLDGLIIRTHGHEVIEEFAEHSEIPIVNALTDFLHPCQIFSDCMTILEKITDSQNPFEGLRGKKIAFLGDTSSNMANSWILASAIFKMQISFGGPSSYRPSDKIDSFCSTLGLPGNWLHTTNALEAAEGADVVYTDVWVSMGCEDQAKQRRELMHSYRVDHRVLSMAKENALFMHCMPAHPGEEVSQEVLDSHQSILFEQAENRLHMQKAILHTLSDFCQNNF